MTRKSITSGYTVKKWKRTSGYTAKKRKRTSGYTAKKRKRTSGYTAKKRKRTTSRRRGGTGNSATNLPREIVNNVTEFLNQEDQAHLRTTNKIIKQHVDDNNELRKNREELEKPLFIQALTAYAKNQDGKKYIFDTDKIKKYLKSPLLDVSIINVNDNKFNLGKESGNMVQELSSVTKNKNENEHSDSLIKTVIEFIPQEAYALVRRFIKPDEMVYNYYKQKANNRVNDIFLDMNAGDEFVYEEDEDDVPIERRKAKIILLGPDPVTEDPVTDIGSNAFAGCENLTTIVIPVSVNNIGDDSFKGCENLTTIVIPELVTVIGVEAFHGCKNLKSITIPKSVMYIWHRTFAMCISLESIIIPESVLEIGQSAFRGCTSLKSITIPKSVTSIGRHAFYGCTSLESIIIPKSVEFIDEGAFYGCPGAKNHEDERVLFCCPPSPISTPTMILPRRDPPPTLNLDPHQPPDGI
jgi:hypothetical protein